MTKENWTFVIALFGALAWSIPLFKLLKHIILKPKLIPHIDEEIEVGFDDHGPYAVFAIAFISQNKNIFIIESKAKFKHSDGSSIEMTWDTLSEVIMETEIDGNYVPYDREQRAIALNITLNEMVDKEITFVNKEFRKVARKFDNNLLEEIEKYEFNQKSISKFKESDIYHEVMKFYRTGFTWKEGQYTIDFSFRDSNKKLHEFKRTFSLLKFDVDELKENQDEIKVHLDAMIAGDEEQDVDFNVVEVYLDE